MDDRHRFKGPLHAVTSLHVDAQWLKRLLQNVRDFITATWLDWLTILIIGAVAAGVRLLSERSWGGDDADVLQV